MKEKQNKRRNGTARRYEALWISVYIFLFKFIAQQANSGIYNIFRVSGAHSLAWTRNTKRLRARTKDEFENGMNAFEKQKCVILIPLTSRPNTTIYFIFKFVIEINTHSPLIHSHQSPGTTTQTIIINNTHKCVRKHHNNMIIIFRSLRKTNARNCPLMRESVATLHSTLCVQKWIKIFFRFW